MKKSDYKTLKEAERNLATISESLWEIRKKLDEDFLAEVSSFNSNDERLETLSYERNQMETIDHSINYAISNVDALLKEGGER